MDHHDSSNHQPRRKRLIALLSERPWTLDELVEAVDAPPAAIRDDLEHIERSLRREGKRLVIEPARCRQCGFRFDARRIAKPGKCPQCRGTWIAPPSATAAD